MTVIPEHEIEIHAIRAQGAGGQHINKVSSAIHLRYDIRASSLNDEHKERLLQMRDRRISDDGVVIIKAQEHRSQDQNRREAIRRLYELVESVAKPPRFRKPTQPSRAAKQRRLEDKRQRSQVKTLRGSSAE
jgi:ribosome-associated protein